MPAAGSTLTRSGREDLPGSGTSVLIRHETPDRPKSSASKSANREELSKKNAAVTQACHTSEAGPVRQTRRNKNGRRAGVR